jgi:hypothetical protein
MQAALFVQVVFTPSDWTIVDRNDEREGENCAAAIFLTKRAPALPCFLR